MTYGGSGATVAAWGLSLGDMAALAGIVIAVIGLIFQVWSTIRRDRREREFHEIRMKTKQQKKD